MVRTLRHQRNLLQLTSKRILPTAAIFTPGCLIVTSEMTLNTTYVQVPQPYYWPEALGIINEAGSLSQAQPLTRKLTYAAATSGALLPLTPRFPNSSYHLPFYGPAVRCLDANQSIVTQASKSVTPCSTCGDTYNFLSWVPNQDHDWTLFTDFSNWSDASVYRTIDDVSSDAFRIYVMPNTSHERDNSRDIFECQLYNASYAVQYNFSDFLQNVQVERELLNMVPFRPADTWLQDLNLTTGDIGPRSSSISYSAIMSAFADLLIGYNLETHYSVTTSTLSKYDLTLIDWTEKAAAKQGMEELFSNITLSLLTSPQLR